jgi:anti-sigma-K factor RskA
VTTRKNLDALASAYVLDALEPEERAEFEAHLAQSAAARIEVAELSATAAVLGLAVEPVAPRDSLRASIVDAAASTPQLSAQPPVVAALPPEDAPEPAQHPLPAERRARARWFRSPLAVLSAVAAAVALIVGGAVVAGTMAESSERLAQADHLAELMAAGDSRTQVVDAGAGMTPKLVWSHGLASSALIVRGLDAAPSGMTYQLWYIDASGARPAGTFSVGDTGDAWRVLDGRMSAGDTVGVTVEPEGGSLTPSSDPIIVVET